MIKRIFFSHLSASRLLTICSIFLFAFVAQTQTIPPPYINYQAVLYDVNGANPNSPLTNQSFSTFVNINDELGNLLYREEHYASTDANGLITVKMGDGLYTAGPITNFNLINWGVGKYYLVVDFDINGTISSTAPEQLVTVPYSFYAGKSGNGVSTITSNGNQTLTITYDNGTTYTTQALVGFEGPQGPAGAQGTTGQSAYDLWLSQGNAGTVDDFLNASAYEIWLAQGNTGTQQDFLNTLVGPQGPAGIQGAIGPQGPTGADGNGIASTSDNGDGTFTFTYDDGSTFTTSNLTGPSGSQDAWGLTGNTGTDQSTNFIGTTNAQDFIIKTNNTESLRVLSSGEVGIGATPDASAKLEVSSTTQGFLPPRLTTVERDAIAGPAVGLLIYNTTTNCLNFYIGSGWNEVCGTASLPSGLIGGLNCGSATNNGSLTEGLAASGVSSEIPYTSGNGGAHNGQTAISTGVTGLTASLSPGNFANGAGVLIYTITGTPSASGTANFPLSVGGQSCILSLTVIANLSAQYPAGSVFCASGPTAIVEVTNPTTGKTWMDRNLGASQVATSSNDAGAYGDLYQWGRGNDGHQCRTSATINNTLSSTDQPNHGFFIITQDPPFDWRNPSNINLWQGTNGTNVPCPVGYRIPTSTEWNNEMAGAGIINVNGAFNSFLKLPFSGFRAYYSGFVSLGGASMYWSSTTISSRSYQLYFNNTNAYILDDARGYGCAVRCIKN